MTRFGAVIAVLKTSFLDFQETLLSQEPANDFSRHLQMSLIRDKATICMGVRRSGKSTFMLQHIRTLLNQGISPQNILHLNFFDEIQIIPTWELFVNRILRTEKCQVFITGSSAHLLSTEIATQMRGRALSWEMFPFTFAEYLDAKHIAYRGHITSKQFFLIQNAFEEYAQVGGFPETLFLSKSLRRKVHQEYLNTILFRDLIERHDISHPKGLIDLAHGLIDNIASLYSINRLSGYLKSLGHKIPKATIAEYIAWFEDSYFLFTVRIFDASLARVNSNPKKIYCIDHAFVNSISSGILINAGHLLENMIFIALRRLSAQIFYYKTHTNREVDFLIQYEDHTRQLIQVCETIEVGKTREREITALNDAMLELGLSEGYLITHDAEETVHVLSGRVYIIPAWQFLKDPLSKETYNHA